MHETSSLDGIMLKALDIYTLQNLEAPDAARCTPYPRAIMTPAGGCLFLCALWACVCDGRVYRRGGMGLKREEPMPFFLLAGEAVSSGYFFANWNASQPDCIIKAKV